jgi:pimeloyl-ACP methyl ester carboxylesterase
VLSIAIGAAATVRDPTPVPAAPSVGQRVGSTIDSVIEKSRSWTSSASTWIKDNAAAARAELDRRIAAAKAAAPEPQVGVDLMTLDTTTGSIRETPVEQIKGPLPETLVILVHGFNEPGGIFDDLAPALIAEGHAVAAFHYPNDQAISASSKLLGDSLKMLRGRGVTQVAFVAHSMGGLITRDVLTSKDFYASVGSGHENLPDAARFIMVDTPNIGSNLARVAWMAEARESVVRWANSDSKDLAILLGALKDGDGEAAKDLLPGSAYLTDLNARVLPADVPMTAIVGIAGEAAGNGLGELLDAAVAKKLLDDGQANKARAAIHEAVTNIGDGVVSETTQVPVGIADVVRVPGFHRTILKTLEVEKSVREATGAPRAVAPSISVIVERLRTLRPSPSTPHSR